LSTASPHAAAPVSRTIGCVQAALENNTSASAETRMRANVVNGSPERTERPACAQRNAVSPGAKPFH